MARDSGSYDCSRAAQRLKHKPGATQPKFFCASRRRHTICLSDWSSDVCSSDLCGIAEAWEEAATKASAIPQDWATRPRAKLRGAISPAAVWHARPASTTSVHPDVAPMTIRARDCSIRHRTMTTTTTPISIQTTSTVTETEAATTRDAFPTRKRDKRKNGRPDRAAVFDFQAASTWNHKSVLQPILRDGHFVASSG